MNTDNVTQEQPKRTALWLTAVGTVAVLVALSAGVRFLGRAAGREVARTEIASEARRENAPEGLLGATWLMTPSEVLQRVPQSYEVAPDQVQVEAVAFDRPSTVDLLFQNGYLVIITVSFNDPKDSATFAGTQRSLDSAYGLFPQPGAEGEFILSTAKSSGGIGIRHMLYRDLPIEQVLLYRQKQ
jgi:hypothetical protein